MKPTLYIIEGPDECGKTTLATSLAKHIKGMYWHSTCTPLLLPALIPYHENILKNAKLNLENGVSVVLDRFWPSEFVYGLMMLRKDSNYRQVYDLYEAEIKKFRHLYIYCHSKLGATRYFKGHTDPMHSLTPAQYDEVVHNYLTVAQVIEKNGNKIISYEIETHGKTIASFQAFIKNISTWNF